jgi:hypothetical protein
MIPRSFFLAKTLIREHSLGREVYKGKIHGLFSGARQPSTDAAIPAQGKPLLESIPEKIFGVDF